MKFKTKPKNNKIAIENNKNSKTHRVNQNW